MPMKESSPQLPWLSEGLLYFGCNNIISQNIIGIGIQLVKCATKHACERKLMAPGSRQLAAPFAQFEVKRFQILHFDPKHVQPTSFSLWAVCAVPGPLDKLTRFSGFGTRIPVAAPLTCSYSYGCCCLLALCVYHQVSCILSDIFAFRFFRLTCSQKLSDRPCRDRQAENVGDLASASASASSLALVLALAKKSC